MSEPKPTIIHVVIQEQYDGDEVIAVFDDAHSGDAYALAYGGDASGRRVEQYPINAGAEMLSQGYSTWSVTVEPDGCATNVKNDGFHCSQAENNAVYYDGTVYVFCWARDRDHAIEIARRERERVLAEMWGKA